jgi:hypothetical protein
MWRKSPSVTLYDRLPMKSFILILFGSNSPQLDAVESTKTVENIPPFSMRMVYEFHIVVHRQAAFPEFDIDDAHLGCVADQLKTATQRRHPWYNKKRLSQVNGSSGFDFLGLGFRAS